MQNNNLQSVPSVDTWLKEAKLDSSASKIGMYLVHNGVVRETPRAKVRQGYDDGLAVMQMKFDFDAAKVDEAIKEAYGMDGIFYVRVWLNKGLLQVGDDIMLVLIGGDIRPHVIDGLQFLVAKIKTECVTEIEYKE